MALQDTRTVQITGILCFQCDNSVELFFVFDTFRSIIRINESYSEKYNGHLSA